MTRYIYTGLIIARKCLIIKHNLAYFKLKTTILPISTPFICINAINRLLFAYITHL